MLNFTSRTNFYICSIPTDMRKEREGLASIVREYFHRDPTALKRLDENQVERLFSKKHASLADFHQALTKELELMKTMPFWVKYHCGWLGTQIQRGYA